MNFILPKLNNADDFEELVRDLFSIKFKNANLQRYGRSGQKQNGIDIVGVAGKDHVGNSNAAIQCKNHIIKINDEKLCAEIDTELVAFDSSSFKDSNYYFATSATNSTNVITHVKTINDERQENSKGPIVVLFWDDISREVINNQALLYKYYGKQLAIAAPEVVTIPDTDINSRKTLTIPLSDFEDSERIPELILKIKKICIDNLGDNHQPSEPYNIYVGISSHVGINFEKRTDIDIDASSYISGTENLEENYEKVVKCLANLAIILGNTFFSKKLVLISDIEINLALLMGKVFRKHRLNINIYFKDMYLTTDGTVLACYPSMVNETFLPPTQLSDKNAEDLVLVVNMALRTTIINDVTNFVSDWEIPYLFRSYGLYNGNKIENSAHANAVADDISSKIHSFQALGLKKIHIFLACPKPLALLIGHKINTLNAELHLYFRSPDRTTYLKTGVLKNNTFENINL